MIRPAVPTSGNPRLEPIDGSAEMIARKAGAREGSQNLLRAQLRAGQHFIEFPAARAVAARLGMHSGTVRPGIGKITITKTGGQR